MKTCSCGKELASNARTCPGCGERFTHPFVKMLALLFILPIIVAFMMAFGGVNTGGDTAEHTDSVGRTVPASITNDADLLVYRCGKPNKDDSTAYDNPRPPIPTRLITYSKAHLMFAYFPGGEVKLGDPPPYSWKLLGIKDTRTNSPIKAGQLKSTLSRRLPCALGN